MSNVAVRSASRTVFSSWAIRSLGIFGGLISLAAGAGLTFIYPAHWGWAAAGFGLWFGLTAYRPSITLFALPALLPIANFAPWTGALTFSEFDLLLCASSAATCFRAAVTPPPGQSTNWIDVPMLASLFALLAVIGLYRGAIDAQAMAASAHSATIEGYAEMTNTWRVAKSLFETVLLLPWLSLEIRHSPHTATRRLALGTLTGLTLVGLSVLWERSAYPGLTNFSSIYRTVALFWEMHVGGAAIDAYLAIATPLVAWALHTARSPWRWACAAIMALLTAYAGLTTFSRGVWGAIAGPLLLLGLWLWGQRQASAADLEFRRKIFLAAAILAVSSLVVAASIVWAWAGLALTLGTLGALLLIRRVRSSGWRVISSRALAVMLVAEVISVIATGSFMTQRMAASDRDFAHRVAHWREGVQLLSTPMEWLFGLGWGRFPANYALLTPGREFSGGTTLIDIGGGHNAIRISGPHSQRSLAGQYGLTQRVALNHPGTFVTTLDARTNAPTDIMVSVCEQHLLYERHCQRRWSRLDPSYGEWSKFELPLEGPALSKGAWLAPRMGILTISVLDAAAAIDIRRIQLRSADGVALLNNEDFSRGTFHWFPVAQDYFVPWHIDNFYLEILIESGLFGVAVFFGLFTRAFWNLLYGPGRRESLSPFLAASLCGALLVGLVSSIVDMPRVAFLLWLLLFVSLLLGRQQQPEATHTPRIP